MILRCTQSDKFQDFCDESYFKSHPIFSICLLSKSSLGSMMNLNVQILLGQRKVYIKLAVHPQGWILPLGTSIWYLWFMRKMQINIDRLKPLLRNLKIRLWLLFHLLNLLYTAHLLTLLLIMWVCIASLVSFNTNYLSILLDKWAAQSVFSGDDPGLTLRSPVRNVNHNAHLVDEPTLTSVSGIKRKSTLNSLQYFCISIMHDILKGVRQCKIKIHLEYLIKLDICFELWLFGK